MSLSLATRMCIESLDRVSSSRNPSRTWANYQIGRLNLWATSLGVFSQGRYSTEHYLRLNDDMTEMLRLIMNGLHDTIDSYTSLGMVHRSDQ
jgi:hypothetical protein